MSSDTEGFHLSGFSGDGWPVNEIEDKLKGYGSVPDTAVILWITRKHDFVTDYRVAWNKDGKDLDCDQFPECNHMLINEFMEFKQ